LISTASIPYNGEENKKLPCGLLRSGSDKAAANDGIGATVISVAFCVFGQYMYLGIFHWDRSCKSFVSLGTHWDIPWDVSA
jgi:hypothetical protein